MGYTAGPWQSKSGLTTPLIIPGKEDMRGRKEVHYAGVGRGSRSPADATDGRLENTQYPAHKPRSTSRPRSAPPHLGTRSTFCRA
jgi:hypothetical protein